METVHTTAALLLDPAELRAHLRPLAVLDQAICRDPRVRRPLILHHLGAGTEAALMELMENGSDIESPPLATRTRDGSGPLFRLITDRSPEAVQAHFEEDLGRPIPLDTLRHFLAGHLLRPKPPAASIPAALSGEALLRRIAAEPESGAYLACDGCSGISNLSSIFMFIASRITRSALTSS